MVFLSRLILCTSWRAPIVASLLLLVAACSGTGPKPVDDGQSSVSPPLVQPKPYTVMPLQLATDIELALLPDASASALVADVDTRLLKEDTANAEAMFIWQVPNQKLSRFDGVRARIFIDQIMTKLQARLRADASFGYRFDVEVKHWPLSDANKLLVIKVASHARVLPELQAIVLDELYIQKAVRQGHGPALEQQFVSTWLAVFLDREVGYRARLQQLPSI